MKHPFWKYETALEILVHITSALEYQQCRGACILNQPEPCCWTITLRTPYPAPSALVEVLDACAEEFDYSYEPLRSGPDTMTVVLRPDPTLADLGSPLHS